MANMPNVPMNHAITTCRHTVDRDKFEPNHEAIFGKRCIKHVSEKLPCSKCNPNGEPDNA